MLIISVYPESNIGIRSQQLFYKVAGLEHITKSAIWNDGVGGYGAIKNWASHFNKSGINCWYFSVNFERLPRKIFWKHPLEMLLKYG